MSSDNIIKKIKAEFFKYMALFLNKIINPTNSEENDKILSLKDKSKIRDFKNYYFIVDVLS